MKYRAMASDLAVEHLQTLFDRYGSRAVEFESVDNILPREYLREVLPRLTPPPHATLFYEVKADLKEHEMAILEQARVTRIQPGIEALSTSSLKLMRKGTTSFQNLRFLMHCQTYHVTPNWNLLIGFPNEPEAVYQKYYEDIPLLTHLYPPGGVFPVRFDRFSPYFKLAAEYSLKLRPSDFYAMIYPFPSEDLEQLAYFFRDAEFQSPYQMSTARWLGKLRERIAQWQALWARDVKPELTLEASGVARLEVDEDVKVVVVGGEGGNFSAGQDLQKFFRELERNPGERKKAAAAANRWRWERLYNYDKPTIAMIQGFCVGGAFMQLLGADFAIAAEDATFSLSEVNWGILPGALVSKVVADAVLPRHALYYACLGEPFDGKEAARIGMINYAVPAKKLEDAVTNLAERLMKKSPAVLRATKHASGTCAQWTCRRPTTISPPRDRRSRPPTRRIPTTPASANSSTRSPTSRPTSRSSSERC